MSATAPRPSLRMIGDPPDVGPRGPALFAKGFRPFFLLAALGAAAAVPIWILALFGLVRPDAYLDAMSWHAHEMVFGFASAVVAGFLLTAVSNWTGRETATGAPLAALAALWIAGRVLFLVPAPRGLVAAVDLAFLPAIAITVARPIVATKNLRNLPMVVALLLLSGANAWVHLDVLGLAPGGRRRGALLGVDLLVVLVAVIAGRVFPMFTRNATGDAAVRSHRALDALAVASLVVVAALGAAGVSGGALAVTCAAAAAFSVARAAHWGARKSARTPLLWILHAGYAWIPIGLVLRTASALGGAVPPALATHALTAGALGCVTLGMMARVSLGHTGRAIAAPPVATAAFALVVGAGVARVAGPLIDPGAYRTWLVASAVLWSAAFTAFLVGYAPVLSRPRVDKKPG